MNSNNISCCFTGYRPQKFPFPIDRESREYIEFENSVYDAVLTLCENGCKTFYCGMAAGFDIIAGEAVLLAKERFCDVTLVCVIPYLEQPSGFSEQWRRRYDELLSKSDKVVLMSDSYYKGCFLKRNRFMVDNSDCVLTWHNGTAGGTKSTVSYAKKLGRRVINLYEKEEILLLKNAH